MTAWTDSLLILISATSPHPGQYDNGAAGAQPKKAHTLPPHQQKQPKGQSYPSLMRPGLWF